MTKLPLHRWYLVLEGRPLGWWVEGGKCMMLIPPTHDKALMEIISTIATDWMRATRDEMLELKKKRGQDGQQ